MITTVDLLLIFCSSFNCFSKCSLISLSLSSCAANSALSSAEIKRAKGFHLMIKQWSDGWEGISLVLCPVVNRSNGPLFSFNLHEFFNSKKDHKINDSKQWGKLIHLLLKLGTNLKNGRLLGVG